MSSDSAHPSSSSSDSQESASSHASRPTIEVRERGAPREGVPQWLDRRLFMELFVFRMPRVDSGAASRVARALEQEGLEGVVYDDVHHPAGLGLLTWSERPEELLERMRSVCASEPLSNATLAPEYTMLGRSYSSGFEPELEWWLLHRPRETALRDDCAWAVWYPLRRIGAFARLDRREQGQILGEHGHLGRAYGDQNLAHDIRLACHGLDTSDNEFVIGLTGPDLHPLSHLVQAMRSTRQTAEFLDKMGPFFVGHVAARVRRNEG